MADIIPVKEINYLNLEEVNEQYRLRVHLRIFWVMVTANGWGRDRSCEIHRLESEILEMRELALARSH
jgi:hypothetical protein